jgi:hypothetical protein
MATISDARLNISCNSGTGICNCVVTGRVAFSQFELNSQQQGLTYRLRCRLIGDDPIDNDLLFVYPARFFPDATPSLSESFRFETNLGRNILNEDPEGGDEIFAELRLSNPTLQPLVVTKNTSNVNL